MAAETRIVMYRNVDTVTLRQIQRAARHGATTNRASRRHLARLKRAARR